MRQVTDWLEKLGMSEYAQRFAENDIDFSLLPELTDQDLEKIGVVSLGHRRKILKAIAALERPGGRTSLTSPRGCRRWPSRVRSWSRVGCSIRSPNSRGGRRGRRHSREQAGKALQSLSYAAVQDLSPRFQYNSTS